MNKNLTELSLSRKISDLYRDLEIKKEVTFESFIDHLGSLAPALVILFLSIPFVLWIAPPGLSIFFGIIIMLNGYRIAKKKRVWIPKFLRNKKIARERIMWFLLKAGKFIAKCEKWIKPRGKFIHRHPIFKIINGWVLAISGFFLALPLPPGTNFTPALTSLLTAIGILEEDGLFILLGYLVFAITFVLYVIFPIFGIQFLIDRN
ncbi:MAG: exopolysaccharide biosynthesis protein [Chlamydiae bacterium]|nr:exopolysaccharide biosynthesis protein [Chlamydiota bacterium]